MKLGRLIILTAIIILLTATIAQACFFGYYKYDEKNNHFYDCKVTATCGLQPTDGEEYENNSVIPTNTDSVCVQENIAATEDPSKENVTATPAATPTKDAVNILIPTPTIYYSSTPANVETKPEYVDEITFMNSLSTQVIQQTNDERIKNGLNALSVDSELSRAAIVRATEIVDTFSHTRPDGSSWSTVSSSVRAENIARGQKTADKVMAAWLSSSGHRSNIMNEGYDKIGVCAVSFNNIIYWVQLFG